MSNINSRLRKKLNKNAPKYYKAEKNNNEEKAQEVAKNIGLDPMGWDCIGNGSGRNVFDMGIFGYDNLVLKLAIPSKYDGISQNKREVNIWNNISDDKREYLVPIIDYDSDYYWIIMRKGSDEYIDDYERLQEIKHELDEIVWREDIKDENYVVIDGDIKLCDYGTNN